MSTQNIVAFINYMIEYTETARQAGRRRVLSEFSLMIDEIAIESADAAAERSGAGL
ncbi:hypothetical protein [Cupriavidus lacunae]|uniref:hypothetical protein n=1 Tax=Cupriavidus lacunae TaxID=2666307 RepID=UPI001374E279|nr:hypothetical protein [Cupriavidus lacunae]